MFKRLSTLFSGKPPAKKKAPAKRKTATAELEAAAAEMGEAAAAMKRAAAEMNRAVTGTPSPVRPAAESPAPAQAPAPAGDDPATAAKVAAQTRADLIRQAMAVRRDKAKALETLPARDQKKLRALAEKMMLGGVEPEASPPGSKPPRRH